DTSLRVKASASTVPSGGAIPRTAFLPPFAGIQVKEKKLDTAARERLLGQGLPGSVLQSLLRPGTPQSGRLSPAPRPARPGAQSGPLHLPRHRSLGAVRCSSERRVQVYGVSRRESPEFGRAHLSESES